MRQLPEITHFAVSVRLVPWGLVGLAVVTTLAVLALVALGLWRLGERLFGARRRNGASQRVGDLVNAGGHLVKVLLGVLVGDVLASL